MLSVIAAAIALFSLIVFVLCAVGVIPRNRAIGLRTNAALRSTTAWRAAHKQGVLPMAVTNVAVLGCLLLHPLGILSEQAAANFALCLLVGGLLWALARTPSR